MITILIGLVVLILMLWGLGVFTKADPKGLALGARRAGGVAALVGAVVLLFRGNLTFALPLGITGFGRGKGSHEGRNEVPARSRACVRRSLKWNSITTPDQCTAGSLPGRAPGLCLTRLTCQRWLRCSPTSTRRAAAYSQLILIAGMPAGVRTLIMVRVRGMSGGPPAK
jgi:hypothetical protein